MPEEADLAELADLDDDEKLVRVLAQGVSYRKVHEVLGDGFSRATVQRRMNERPDLRQRVAEAREAIATEAIARVEGLSGYAVDRLQELAGDDNSVVALKAAQYLYEKTIAGRDTKALAVRVAELERQLAAAPLRRVG